jgi:deoxyhypusine synthase
MVDDLKKTDSIKNLVKQFATSGFQASELSKAVELMDKMLDGKTSVFLAFTANLVASGVRGTITQLIREKKIAGIITTGGSIDHDLIKSHSNYLEGSFYEDDVALHKRGVNRLGNILVPNQRYVLLEKKVMPLFEKLYEKKKVWATSDLISELSVLAQGDSSFLAECRKKNVPIFSPGFIDSALGLQLYFFKQDHPDFIIDETADLLNLGRIVLNAEKTGAIILGGGISKHFTIASNILRDGLDYSVYFTTATPFDGSLSGAVANEAKSWGKIKEKASSVTVHGDASILFPIAVNALQ